jgi:hypothetical protein
MLEVFPKFFLCLSKINVAFKIIIGSKFNNDLL